MGEFPARLDLLGCLLVSWVFCHSPSILAEIFDMVEMQGADAG